MRGLVLALVLVMPAFGALGCDGPSGASEDAADDVLDNAAKADGDAKPLGTYAASEDVDGRLALVVLKSDGSFHRERASCDQVSCRLDAEDGTYVFTRSSTTSWVRFLGADGALLDRYAYALDGDALTVRRAYTSTSYVLAHATAAWCGTGEDCALQDLAAPGCAGGLFACASNTCGTSCPPPACDATDSRTVPVTAWAEPDAGEGPYAEVLAGAEQSIRVLAYLMGKGRILDTLVAKATAGKSVHIILDVSQQPANQAYFDQLTAAGAKVIWSDPEFSYMHAKTFVVDGQKAVISTGNFPISLLAKERNFAALDTDPADVATLVALFDADFERRSPDLSCTRLVVSPVNSRDRILALIEGAQQSLVIESMQFADSRVRAAVAARHRAGVAVRVLLADPSWIATNTDAATFLTAAGVPVRRMLSPRVHAKAIVADGAQAYLGSENLSATSLDKNREVGLILTRTEADAVQLIADTFEADWLAATAF